MSTPRHGDLEIESDLAFQRRDWLMQRIGWWVLVAAIAAALIGAFGKGPLSHARARAGDGGLEVRYDRITRHGATLALELSVAPQQVRDSAVEVWMSRALIAAVMVRRIDPQPIEEHSAGDRIVYRFRVADGAHPVPLVFHIEPDKLWGHQGGIGLVGGDSVRVSLHVLP